MPPPNQNPEKISFLAVQAEEFILNRDKLEKDLLAFLTPHDENHYIEKNTKLFLSEDKKSGFGINPDGELVSVFSTEKKRGKILVAEARKSSAKHLSCMGEHLLSLYSEFGFSQTSMSKWDNRFAPKDWNYERFGEPNIYEMKI